MAGTDLPQPVNDGQVVIRCSPGAGHAGPWDVPLFQPRIWRSSVLGTQSPATAPCKGSAGHAHGLPCAEPTAMAAPDTGVFSCAPHRSGVVHRDLQRKGPRFVGVTRPKEVRQRHVAAGAEAGAESAAGAAGSERKGVGLPGRVQAPHDTWEVAFSTFGGGVNRAPPQKKLGVLGGGWEKGSIDRTINRLLWTPAPTIVFSTNTWPMMTFSEPL